jgi:hypothetical protein
LRSWWIISWLGRIEGWSGQEKESSFSEEKEAKRLLFPAVLRGMFIRERRCGGKPKVILP